MHKNIMKQFVMGFGVSLLMFGSTVAQAGFVDSKVIEVYGSSWTDELENVVSRSGRSAYAYARNHSVYPDNGAKDNFEKIQCRIVNDYDLQISNTCVLSETSKSFTSIKIYEGYRNGKTVNFEFKGNTAKNAVAVVSYGSD